MFGILHISYPKIWVTLFIERWVSISNFQFNIVLYNLGQHSLDSKFFSFWKQFPDVFYCPTLVINLTARNLFWGITVLNPRNLQLLKIYPQNGKSMLQILDKKWLSKDVWDPKKWHTCPCIQKWQVPLPPKACYKQNKRLTKSPRLILGLWLTWHKLVSPDHSGWHVQFLTHINLLHHQELCEGFFSGLKLFGQFLKWVILGSWTNISNPSPPDHFILMSPWKKLIISINSRGTLM